MALPDPRRFRVFTNPAGPAPAETAIKEPPLNGEVFPETETATRWPRARKPLEAETETPPPWTGVHLDPETEEPWDLPQGKPVTQAERAGGLIRHWLRAAARSEMWGGGEHGLLHEVRNPKPETMAGHWKHVTSIRFLPEGATGWVRILPPLLVVLHLLITAPVKAAAKTARGLGLILIATGDRADWTADRLLRLIPSAAVIAVVLVILAHLI
jgi:hypothetical protein